MALSKLKVNQENTVINLLGNSNRTQATISPEAVQHILESLTKNYENPIEGLVRETISNALDATSMIDPKDRRPVEVYSPSSSYHRYFTVVDYGVGMDQETLEENFVQYGRSLKLEDFNQNGAHGMGAKAPLAYTEEFKAVTIKDGTKIHYLVQRDSDGIWGEVLKKESTTERNGTTITVALKSDIDVPEFEAAIQKYVRQAYDLPILIDGEPTKFFDHYFEVGSIVMEETTQTTGRVWMRRDAMLKLLMNEFDPTSRGMNVSYLVGGWAYPVFDKTFGRDNIDYPEMYVELKPGLVDFNQARDSIIDNSRAKRLRSVVEHAVFQNTESVRNFFIAGLQQMSKDEADTMWWRLNKHLRGKISTETDMWEDDPVIYIEEYIRLRYENEKVAGERFVQQKSGREMQRFTFKLSELENADGNAMRDILEDRERNEVLKHVFLVPDKMPAVHTGGYDHSNFNDNVPVFPKYHEYEEIKVTEYADTVRMQHNNEFSMSLQYFDKVSRIPKLLAIVNDDNEHAAKLVRQRRRIVDLVLSNQITLQAHYTPQEEEAAKRNFKHRIYDPSYFAIAYVAEEHVPLLETMEHTEVLVVDREQLRQDIRGRQLKEQQNAAREESPEYIEETKTFKVRPYTLHFDGVLENVEEASNEEIFRVLLEKVSTEGSIDSLLTYQGTVGLTLEEMQGDTSHVYAVAKRYGMDSIWDARDILDLLFSFMKQGKPIQNGMQIYVAGNRTFTAAELAILHAEYPNFHVGEEWGYNAKISTDIHAQRAVNSEVLEDLISSIPQNEQFAVAYGYLNAPFRNRGKAIKTIAAMLSETAIRDAALDMFTVADTVLRSPMIQAFQILSTYKKGWDYGIRKAFESIVHQNGARYQQTEKLANIIMSYSTIGRSPGLHYGLSFARQYQYEQSIARDLYEGINATDQVVDFTVKEASRLLETDTLRTLFTKHVVHPIAEDFLAVQDGE